MESLNGIGGQLLLGAAALLLMMLSAAIGKRLGVTPRQVREVLQLAREARLTGGSLVDKDMAREVEKRLRRWLI